MKRLISLTLLCVCPVAGASATDEALARPATSPATDPQVKEGGAPASPMHSALPGNDLPLVNPALAVNGMGAGMDPGLMASLMGQGLNPAWYAQWMTLPVTPWVWVPVMQFPYAAAYPVMLMWPPGPAAGNALMLPFSPLTVLPWGDMARQDTGSAGQAPDSADLMQMLPDLPEPEPGE